MPAIFFSDIVVPLKLAGVDVDIVPGPRARCSGRPIRTRGGCRRAAPARRRMPWPRSPRPSPAPVAELGATPLIGFAGAPFTLAAYLVEGGPSKDHLRARTLMHADPHTWARC